MKLNPTQKVASIFNTFTETFLGDPEGLILNEDIDSIKDKLRQSHEQLKTVFKAISDAVVVQESTGKIVFANEQTTRLLECTEQNLIKDPSFVNEKFNFLDEHGHKIDTKHCPALESFTGKKVEGFELQLVNKKNGHSTWLIANSVPVFDQNGKVEFVVTSATDTTSLKNKEDVIRKKSRHIELYEQYYGGVVGGDRKKERELKNAINKGEITLFYQPIINAREGTIKGVEALVRWNHPTKGLVFPKDFVHLAEMSGLIGALGHKVLRLASGHAKVWSEMGIQPLPISINLSPLQFLNPKLVEEMSAILNETRFNPEFLEIEITEGTAMKDAEQTSKILRALTKMGIKVNIDDFGTGYSSLSYLKQFPIHSLKIDRSFVVNCTKNPSDGAIIRAIVTMAQALNVRVTVEGIETIDQYNLLSTLGCDYLQGYLISPPIPAEKIVEWIKDYSNVLEKRLFI